MFESCWAHHSFQSLAAISLQRPKAAVVVFVDDCFPLTIRRR
jgi:hypothetical protein